MGVLATKLNVISIYLEILLLTAGFSLNAQTTLESGKVKDSLQNPLPYANILAIPEANDQDIRFAITENDGSYKLGLVKNQTYKVTVSYLGYKSQTIEITTTEDDVVKDFSYCHCWCFPPTAHKGHFLVDNTSKG